MARRIVATFLALSLSALPALAQQPQAPIPLYPGAQPRPVEAEPLPPAPAAPPGNAADPAPASGPPPQTAAPPQAAALPQAAPPAAPDDRVFCNQPVAVHLADPEATPARYRHFVGVFSDASWTPSLCAALIVEKVAADGTASIAYVYGPMSGSTAAPALGAAAAGGILHGTGVVRDGALGFQNSDGSQFVFRPLYADLDGHLTTPQGQSYEAIFKKTP